MAPISNVMSPCPYFIEQNQSMSAAHAIMRQHGIRHLPVCEHGKLVGLVSAGDLHLLETLDGVDPNAVLVKEAMTPEPYQVRPNAPLADVVRVMARNKYGCVLVTQGAEIVGIFTTIDALRAFATVLGA
ncbi:MAG TPA: CBS domain-containing protein [Polyangiaceae bacterium]|jgi:acetoin utilization protein AcuB|nr:CBS domain-containing protein [Polyangiaceae bacterium]